MHIEIHSISGHELLVETGTDDLEVTQVYREVSPDGRTHTITVVIEDLLVDDTDEEEDLGEDFETFNYRSTPDYMGLQGTDGTRKQGPSGIVDAHGYIRGNR